MGIPHVVQDPMPGVPRLRILLSISENDLFKVQWQKSGQPARKRFGFESPGRLHSDGLYASFLQFAKSRIRLITILLEILPLDPFVPKYKQGKNMLKIPFVGNH